MKLSIAILLLTVCAVALAIEHHGDDDERHGGRMGGRGGHGGPMGGRGGHHGGRRGGPGGKHDGPGCFSICKDDCKGRRHSRFETCLKPCFDNCPKGDWKCKMACKKNIDCEMPAEDENDACMICRKSDEFQTCIKPFKDCAQQNCGKVCPKPEGVENRFHVFATNPECRKCVKSNCKKSGSESFIADIQDLMAIGA